MKLAFLAKTEGQLVSSHKLTSVRKFVKLGKASFVPVIEMKMTKPI